ncbi:MAG: GRP family sugar transporter [Alphaproteobacteria bacterium]|nr:GRP family sugar transporter [Alphaproteobacteria bacterium]
MVTGYLLAFITSVLFSIYLVPRKFASQNPAVYTVFFGAGFFALSVIYWASCGFDSLLNPILLGSSLAGILCALGFIIFTKAIDSIGLAQANQWKNLQGPIGVVLGLWLLAEIYQTNIFWVIAAAAAIFISAAFLTVQDSAPKKLKLTGVLLAVISALCFGIMVCIQKWVVNSGVSVPAQLVCTSAFMLVSAAAYSLLMLKNQSYRLDKNNRLGLLAGMLWFPAGLCTLWSFELLPVSIAFTIIQLNAVWTILIGVLIFREISIKQYWGRISFGLIFSIVGIICLIFA